MGRGISARKRAKPAPQRAENPQGESSQACMVYDDSCAMCSAAARWVERNTDVELVPGSTSDLSAEALDASVWLVGDGESTSRALAVAGILKRSRRWWWRAGGHVLAVWGIRHVGDVVYRVIAANRHRFTKSRG